MPSEQLHKHKFQIMIFSTYLLVAPLSAGYFKDSGLERFAKSTARKPGEVSTRISTDAEQPLINQLYREYVGSFFRSYVEGIVLGIEERKKQNRKDEKCVPNDLGVGRQHQSTNS